MVANRRLAAIMFTDMVDFTALTQADEAGTLQLLREEERIVRALTAAHQGREIKSTGDGFLVEFDSALRAVECAIDIQEHLRTRNAQSGVKPISLRVGVHLGDVEEREGDIFGDAVNIASRIEPLAAPDGVCISGSVYDQVRNKISHRLEKLGPKVLKNVRVPTDVYRVMFPGEFSGPLHVQASPTRIAVLPLANISPDPKDEYFADGLTEELISTLSKLSELRVVARTSVSQYKSGAKPVSQIGTELGVGTVLEGSVRKAGNRLRITLQLIDVDTEAHVWAQSYDRDMDDIFAIQSEIAEKTAATLRVRLLGTEVESIRKRPTLNVAAYDVYLKGIHAARTLAPGRFLLSMKYFEQAVALDPNFSAPYSSMADMYLLQAGETIAPAVAFPRAKGFVAKAIELDPDSSDAHTARGNLALQFGHDWDLAEVEFRQALSLNPSDANAHFWYGILCLALNRFDEAFDEFRSAIELDPLWEDPGAFLRQAYAFSGDLTLTIKAAEEGTGPENSMAHIHLGQFYWRAGRIADAQKEADASTKPTHRYGRADWVALQVMLGHPEEARGFLAELEKTAQHDYVSPTLLAELHSILGEHEEALRLLEKDFADGTSGLWLEHHLVTFDPIRRDPRFQAILKGLKLPLDEELKPGAGVPPDRT